ncbi:MAG: endopeptidase La [Acidobacteria bacterium]|nr:MAG: endopeptidase La [Acidobacteriota bacterium]
MAATRIETLPTLPLREAVVFPKTMVPFVVGRPASLKALERAAASGKRLFLACQRDAAVENPGPDEIHSLGTIGAVVQSLHVAGGNVRVLVEGICRARALAMTRSPDGYLQAEVEPVEDRAAGAPGVPKLVREVSRLFESYVACRPDLGPENLLPMLKVRDPGRLADTIAAHLPVAAEVRQELLERLSVLERLERLVRVLEAELDKAELDRKIDGQVRKRLEKAQREYYLSEKIRAIQQELGRGGENEFEQLRRRIDEARMPDEARRKALEEVRRLEAMPPVSAEATVSRTYLDWLLSVPWHRRSPERRDLARARRVLESDHFGLERVKERILEHLAVRKLAPRKRQGTILCFVGPPGVGKTSLARSIARATGRKFVRLSLGGVRDEAEIRGHRRTYVGAFPGRLIQMLRKAGTCNPVFLLDELDKMSVDFRGDPSAALLEALDPEQNSAFLDHYLDVEFDLSHVFFIATANVTHSIPPALLDRLEVIRIAGYTFAEKREIARRYLVPRQLDAAGLARRGVTFTDEALETIIDRYTREAGVRQLEREIARVCRKLARGLVEKEWRGRFEVTAAAVADLLGAPRYLSPERRLRAGVGAAIGLAWTPAGGDVLVPEASAVPGRGRLVVTGQVGDVMQESARAALTYVRSRAAELGIDPGALRRTDLHIHVPEGAIPKDGPSAGVALATGLVSLLAGIPARAEVAMTGEITLRGRVLAVGGIKEKVLAAHRCGVKTVLLPRENEKDLAEIPEDVLQSVEIVLVEHLDEVLPRALERPPASLPLLATPGEAEAAPPM